MIADCQQAYFLLNARACSGALRDNTTWCTMFLLFGGNGFLGMHVARAAVQQGVDVGVIGRRVEPSPRLPEGVAYAQTGTAAASDLLAQSNTILYLAHASRPARHGDGLSYELNTNVASLNAFLGELTTQGFTGQLFYASSGGQVYGRHPSVPAQETDPALPQTAYGMGKLMCEQVVRYHARVSGTNAAILRIANPVGTGQIGTGHGLVGAVFRALRDDVPLSLFGTGTNVRDYFSADAFGEFITDLHLRSWRGDGTFNIGSGVGHTELDVFELVRDVVGRGPEIIFKDARAFDLPYAVVDPSKAKGQLGWDPKQDLRQIIETMAAESLRHEGKANTLAEAAATA